jgi:hypothetical protein
MGGWVENAVRSELVLAGMEYSLDITLIYQQRAA